MTTQVNNKLFKIKKLTINKLKFQINKVNKINYP